MNLQETIKKLKETVQAFNSEEEQTFADYKTTDGVILRCNELVEGATVSIISEEGEAVSGAASYVLEDGKTVEVSEEGVIVSIMEAAEEAEELNKDEVKEEMHEEKDCKDKYEERLTSLENSIKDIVGMFESQIEKFNKDLDLQKELDSLKAEFETFKGLPAEKEIEIAKITPKSNTKEDRLKAIAKFKR